METVAAKNLSISRLDKTHKRQLFSCGVKSLDDYISQQAGQEIRKHISVTYILNDEALHKIAGYYTLSSTTIELTDLSDELSRKLPHYPLLPATLIGRLAVDLHYQKNGIGEILLVDALRRAYQASQEIASFAVIVEAINESAAKFYKKYNFMTFSPDKNKLYLPMEVIGKIG